MNTQEFEQLKTVLPGLVTAENLVDKSPRTLLFGYTCDRNSWHVYLGTDGVIHLVCYSDGLLIAHTQGHEFEENRSYIPNKRLYGESCDFEFCRLLTLDGQSLPFTTFEESSAARRLEQFAPYAARVFEDVAHDASSLLTSDMVSRPGPAAHHERALRQAAAELRARHELAYRGVLVRENQAQEVLARAHELADEISARALNFKGEPRSWVQAALYALGVYDGYVESAEMPAGHVIAEVEFTTEFGLGYLESRGFAVTRMGRLGLYLTSEDHRIVLAEKPFNRPENLYRGYYLLEHFFGCEVTFLLLAGGYCNMTAAPFPVVQTT